MAILFCAIVLIALAYALAIGWTKPKITSRTWTTEAQPASGQVPLQRSSQKVSEYTPWLENGLYEQNETLMQG